MLMLAPRVISSIMGLYAPAFVSELKARGILWFANATTVAEAKSKELLKTQAPMPSSRRAGQSAKLARDQPAGTIAQQLWGR